MYLLYADESGTTHDPKSTLFLPDFACLNGKTIGLPMNSIQLHQDSTPLIDRQQNCTGVLSLGRKELWRGYPKADKEQAIVDALDVFRKSHVSNRLFASVINKALVSPDDPITLAFEQLASRFDDYLQRLHNKQNDTRRGIIIFEKTTYELSIQALAADFRSIGHTWGIIRNFSEVPLFLESKASRLIQLADLIAYSVFRFYEKGDDRFYSIIKNRLDSDGDISHGLHSKL